MNYEDTTGIAIRRRRPYQNQDYTGPGRTLEENMHPQQGDTRDCTCSHPVGYWRQGRLRMQGIRCNGGCPLQHMYLPCS